MLTIKKIISKIYRLSIPFKAFLLRRKKVIKVAFIFSNVDFWKNDALYLQMIEHPRFDPFIIIVPDLMVHNDFDSAIFTSESYLKNVGYKYYSPFSQEEDVEIMSRKKPNIIFYPRPYNAYPDGFRYEDNFCSLFCYSHYGYHTIIDSYIIDTRFINHVWQNYYENASVKSEVESVYPHLNNIVVTGLPNTDSFFSHFRSQWKTGRGVSYRVIWAPHFSVNPGWLNYSNFLEIAEEMLEYVMSEKFIQFAFKPHPLLKNTLYNHPDWGVDKTNQYYQKWNMLENAQLVEGDYIGLFMQSDAMIHDCSSFLVEYLHANKPVMFLTRDEENMVSGMLKVGVEALNCHYKGKTVENIKDFISNVVIGGDDPMKSNREHFIEEFLTPPSNQTASQNIIHAILGK